MLTRELFGVLFENEMEGHNGASSRRVHANLAAMVLEEALADGQS